APASITAGHTGHTPSKVSSETGSGPEDFLQARRSLRYVKNHSLYYPPRFAMQPAMTNSQYGKILLPAAVLILLASAGTQRQAAAQVTDTVGARAELLRLESRWLAAHDS